MSTVDYAVEAGARALLAAMSRHEYPGEDREHEWAARQVLPVAHAVWPILSAGLRELHWQMSSPGICYGCGHVWPCPTVRDLDRIDKELGNG